MCWSTTARRSKNNKSWDPEEVQVGEAVCWNTGLGPDSNGARTLSGSETMVLEASVVTTPSNIGRAGVFASCANHELVTRTRLISIEHSIVGEGPVLHNHTMWAVGRHAEARVVVLVRRCV